MTAASAGPAPAGPAPAGPAPHRDVPAAAAPDPRAVHRQLLALVPRARLLLGGAVVAGLAGAALLVVQSLALAHAVAGAAFDGRDLASLTPTLLVLAVAVAGRALLAAAGDWLGRRAAERAMAELRHRVGAELLAARPRQVEQARRGELATAAVHGVDALADYYATAVPQVALAAAVPPALVAVVLWHDPLVGVLLGLTLPLVVVFMVLVGRESAARIGERRQALGVLGAHFLDVVRGLPTLRAHGRAEAQAATLERIGERYRLESVAALRVAFLSALVLELLAMVGTAVAAAVVGVQLAGGSLGFEAGLVVLLLAPEVYAPLRRAGQRYHAAEDGAHAAQALLALTSVTSHPAQGVDVTEVDPARAALTLRGVRVAGGGGRVAALDGLDVRFAPGRMTALIGPSGAGKSTLLRLLARLGEPDEGWSRAARPTCERSRARCGGSSSPGCRSGQRCCAARCARPSRSNIPPRPPLSWSARCTARPRGRSSSSWADFDRALATPVGVEGRGLAGGQAQRLALAGALLSRAPLLLLDEPTAHLDPASAASAAAGIRAAAAGRTAIVATHDPAVIAVCDDVVSLREGRVAAPAVLGAVA